MDASPESPAIDPYATLDEARAEAAAHGYVPGAEGEAGGIAPYATLHDPALLADYQSTKERLAAEQSLAAGEREFAMPVGPAQDGDEDYVVMRPQTDAAEAADTVEETCDVPEGLHDRDGDEDYVVMRPQADTAEEIHDVQEGLYDLPPREDTQPAPEEGIYDLPPRE